MHYSPDRMVNDMTFVTHVQEIDLSHDRMFYQQVTSIEIMVRWVVGSIIHEVDPLSYFSFEPVLHDWCNKGRGMLSCLWDDAYKRTLAANLKE